MLDTEIDTLIATFGAAARRSSDPAYALAGLAKMIADKKHPLRALALAREALGCAQTPRAMARSRYVLASLMPGYTTPMMNDPRRNPAWDAALRRAIRPGMHALEIGTGAGMLAMMAGRAGATVTTCEKHEISATWARELVAHNGLAGRVKVVAKDIGHVVPEDMERPADLLFCDIFGDALFDFDPLTLVADARRRLLSPQAVFMPARVAMRVAFVNDDDHARQHQMNAACGFDLSPMAGSAMLSRTVQTGDPQLTVMSDVQDIFRFDLAVSDLATRGTAQAVCTIVQGGVINGMLHWIRLELDDQTVLEPRPEPNDGKFFSAMRFTALAEPLTVTAGQRLTIGASHDGKRSEIWLAG